MPDNVKMSLQNALTIVGLLIACGVSYSSIMSNVKMNRYTNEKQDAKIEKLEYNSSEAALARQKNAILFSTIQASQARVEAWIKSIDEIKITGEY